MKIKILILVAFIFAAFKNTSTQKPVELNQVNGITIFVHCKPAFKYDSIGTFKSGFWITDLKTSSVLDFMTKRAKEKFPNCNALIFTHKDLTEATAIVIE